MNRADIQLLYEYDRWANDRVFLAASALDAAKFIRDLGGSFSSVRDTLVHILAGEWIWLSYWSQPSHTTEALAELRTRRQSLFNPSAFPDLAAVRSKWAEIQKLQLDFLARLTNEFLEHQIPFRDTHTTLAHQMQHMANHSTYHRGQISLMMRQLHAEPIATDFHLFVIETRREPAAK